MEQTPHVLVDEPRMKEIDDKINRLTPSSRGEADVVLNLLKSPRQRRAIHLVLARRAEKDAKEAAVVAQLALELADPNLTAEEQLSLGRRAGRQLGGDANISHGAVAAMKKIKRKADEARAARLADLAARQRLSAQRGRLGAEWAWLRYHAPADLKAATRKRVHEEMDERAEAECATRRAERVAAKAAEHAAWVAQCDHHEGGWEFELWRRGWRSSAGK